MKRILSTAFIFIVVFSTFAMFTIQSGGLETEYQHRKTIIVDNSGNSETLTNYQVFINVTYDTDMQADFDDLRFNWYDETSGQEVDLDYWLDKYIDSEYALIWVEVPEIRGSGEEVLYMYYGDPDAASESNGEETFVFFDGFSTDTTANYHLWSPIHPTGNPNEFSWDLNGWLFVNASIRERPGRNSNVHVYHKTAVMDPSEDQYWLETRCKAFGDGSLDYIGACNLFKRDSMPQDVYFRCARVTQGIGEVYPMNRCSVSGGWGGWEFSDSCDLPLPVIDQWFRIGLGTASNGTVVGSFRNDNYAELCTLVAQTTHQDVEWWVDLVISRKLTHDWATMNAYFDYVRVRKFADPEPTIRVLPKYFELIEDYFPHWKFSKGEKWYPCSFYFDNDDNITNNPENYKNGIGQYDVKYVYVRAAEDEHQITLEYWLYYAFNDAPWFPLLFNHEHDWDSTVTIVLDKGNLNEPRVVYFFHHKETGFSAEPQLWADVTKIDGTHIVTYVANGTHGAYHSSNRLIMFPDIWVTGGFEYGSEDFNWIIAEECEFDIEHDDCWVPHITIGLPQNEPNEGYWPHHYPRYVPNWVPERIRRSLPTADPAPWHRPEWERGMPSVLTLEMNPSTARPRDTVTFSGQLIPQISADITLKCRRLGSSWWFSWDTLSTQDDGYFSKSYSRFLWPGVYEFVAEWSGNDEYPHTYSHIATLTITRR